MRDGGIEGCNEVVIVNTNLDTVVEEEDEVDADKTLWELEIGAVASDLVSEGNCEGSSELIAIVMTDDVTLEPDNRLQVDKSILEPATVDVSLAIVTDDSVERRENFVIDFTVVDAIPESVDGFVVEISNGVERTDGEARVRDSMGVDDAMLDSEVFAAATCDKSLVVKVEVLTDWIRPPPDELSRGDVEEVELSAVSD